MADRSWVADPRVEEYLGRLPGWQAELGQRVRALAHRTDPELTETIKRTVRPYFVLQGNVAALLGTKDHLNVFLYDGGIVADPEGIITHGHHNATARQIALHEGDQLNEQALGEIFAAIIANNRAGGWRRVLGS